MTFREFQKFNRSLRQHRAHRQNLVRNHRRACRLALEFGREGFVELCRSLHDRATDERTLRAAWNQIAQTSGETPGVDGEKCSHFPDPWPFVREMRDLLRKGNYQHGETRVYEIKKKSGRGIRRIEIPNLDDRVVQKALALVLAPVLDARFNDCSFGFRPGLGRFDAVAYAERLLEEDRLVILTEDIKDAFSNVPQQRLLDVVGKYLPERKIKDLISRVVRTQTGRGLRQGGALSPLLLNLFLHHLLDRSWRKKHPEWPTVRYVDDIAIFCKSPEDAADARQALVDMLRPAGFMLKTTGQTTISDLGRGEAASWLGFDVRWNWADEQIALRIGEDAWNQLPTKISKLIRDADPPARVEKFVRGWIGQLGPVWRSQDLHDFAQRVNEILKSVGIRRRLHLGGLRSLWHEAHIRWTRRRRRYRPVEDFV